MKKDLCLNVGCGILLHGEREDATWINMDNTLTQEGIDSKEGMCQNVKTEEGYQFVQGDIQAIPFEDETFDYLESMEMIEHVPVRDVLPAFKEMYRVLKPGGRLILMTTDITALCRLWVKQIDEGTMTDDKWGFLVGAFYGNQVSEGEYHRSAFTVDYLHWLAKEVGFKEEDIKMFAYPPGTKLDDFKGVKWGNLVTGMPMILIDCIKN